QRRVCSGSVADLQLWGCASRINVQLWGCGWAYRCEGLIFGCGFGEGVVVADKIEREIEIGVPIDHVWGLVVQPGWWVDADQAAAGDWSIGSTTVVTYDENQFPVRVESVDPAAHRVTFRWASTFPDDDITDGNSTLIEFTLTD